MDWMTQAEIAAYLDLSERSVRELLPKLGLDHRSASIDEIRVAYIRKLREEAAGRGDGDDDDGVSLTLERALLARSQREGQEIRNAVARGTYAAIEVLANVLADASQAVADHFDQINTSLKMACPDLSAAERKVVMDAIGRARNEWVTKTSSLLADQLGAADMPVDEDSDEETPIDDQPP